MDVFFSLLSGALSGAASRTAVAPFERLIILKQTQNPEFKDLSIIESLKKMMGVEGYSSFFKGNGSNCARVAPFQAIEFFSFEKYKKLFSLLGLSDYQRYLLCGMLSGMTASSSVYPLDLLRVIFSVQTTHTRYEGIVKTLVHIYKEKGIVGLYKGWSVTMMGIGPYASLKLSTFQMLKNYYYGKEFEKREFSSTVNLMFGSLAGAIAMTITYPTDVLRRRIMVTILNDDVRPPVITMIKDIISKEGIKSFYSGMLVTYFKVIPSTALAFTFNERLKKLFGVSNVKKKH